LDKDIVADNFSLLAEHKIWRTFGFLSQENKDLVAKKIIIKPDNFKKVLLEINLKTSLELFSSFQAYLAFADATY